MGRGAGGGGRSGSGSGGDSVGMSPDDITPVNDITNQSKFEDIAADMKENGWQGDPILAYEGGNGMQSVTGSHRIYAAREAGLNEIPVSVIKFERGSNSYDTFERDIEAFLNAQRDEDILRVFKDNKFVQKGYITKEQYNIFKREVKNNG